MIRLAVLAAIWGASFLFTRISVPVFGPTLLVEWRMGLAALLLAAVSLWLKRRLEIKTHWKYFLVLGLVNSALPFLLFSFAAQTVSASLLSILNATAPIWGAIIGAVWTRQALSNKTMLGLALGVAGVAILVGFDEVTLRPGAGIAITAGLCAACCYGIANTYAKAAKSVDPFANAHGSMWAAALLIAPAVPFFPATAVPDLGIMADVFALGVVCTGIAYLLYFQLVADLGAASALTVTFLIPVFGVLWGWLFLGETVGWHTVAGSVTVIIGTVLVTGFTPGLLFAKRVGANA
ncbi:MAG: DMT family transporter [Gammaproteobacteria bacterium]|nr:DMT family transporter [Gammaproteobacteria bacterium]